MVSKNGDVSDLQADVLIIGAGGAGLPAAVRAAEAGAKVIVIEKRKILGGSARLTAGLLAMETAAHKRQGIRGNADDYFRMHMDLGNWTGEAMLVRKWVTGVPDVVWWLESKGLEFRALATSVQIAGKGINTGNTVVNTLLQDGKNKGVQYLTETTAKKIVKDKNGSVTGVIAEQKGKELKISAKAVMIATGSMSRNKELQKKYFPYIDFDSMSQIQLPYTQGDGYFMAMASGAAPDGLVGALFVGPCTHPHNTRVGNIVRRPHMMVVNRRGQRFYDESMWGKFEGFWPWPCIALNNQPGRVAWSLMDDKILKDMIKNKEMVNMLEVIYGQIVGKSIDDLRKCADIDAGVAANEDASPVAWLDTVQEDIESEAKEGRVKISNSWDEIAEYIGADPTVLKDQVKRYNTFCRNGYDADLLKVSKWLLPLTTPPFYALEGHQALDLISGGIRITPNMEVMGEDDLKPIPGLYAGGVQCSGWFVYPSGEANAGGAFSFSLYSGYTAGKIMAEYALAKK